MRRRAVQQRYAYDAVGVIGVVPPRTGSTSTSTLTVSTTRVQVRIFLFVSSRAKYYLSVCVPLHAYGMVSSSFLVLFVKFIVLAWYTGGVNASPIRQRCSGGGAAYNSQPSSFDH